MFVFIFFFGEVFDEVHMLSVTYVDGTGSFSAKFMKVFIRKVGVELNLMEMIFFVRGVFGFAGYGTESMIMAFITFIENTGAAG